MFSEAIGLVVPFLAASWPNTRLDRAVATLHHTVDERPHVLARVGHRRPRREQRDRSHYRELRARRAAPSGEVSTTHKPLPGHRAAVPLKQHGVLCGNATSVTMAQRHQRSCNEMTNASMSSEQLNRHPAGSAEVSCTGTESLSWKRWSRG